MPTGKPPCLRQLKIGAAFSRGAAQSLLRSDSECAPASAAANQASSTSAGSRDILSALRRNACPGDGTSMARDGNADCASDRSSSGSCDSSGSSSSGSSSSGSRSEEDRASGGDTNRSRRSSSRERFLDEDATGNGTGEKKAISQGMAPALRTVARPFGNTKRRRRKRKPDKPVMPPAKRSASTVDEFARSKVDRLLTRACGQGHDLATDVVPDLGSQIEHELFELDGGDAIAYRRHARSLIFGLGAADRSIRDKVVRAEITPAQLVRLDTERLAPEELQTKRKAAQDKYFREQIHLTRGPPKSKRDLGLHRTSSMPPLPLRSGAAD